MVVLGVYLSEAVTASPFADVDLKDESDLALAVAAAEDPGAFVQLYDRYRQPIYRYCLSRLDGQQAAVEATADVFLEVYQHLCRFPGGPFAPWLYTIARHVVSEHRQGRRLSSPAAR